MIIKGVFRRYERWNPVHPTYGAFWGMGIGFGCGVGWGPGFGPEVIGYVGAGCGVGFSVGITLAGVGIGLPANFIFSIPYNTAVAAKKSAIGLLAGFNDAPFLKNFSMDGWNDIRPQVAALPRQLSEEFSSFNRKPLLNKGIGIKNLPSYISDGCGRVGNHLICACKGLKGRHPGDASAT